MARSAIYPGSFDPVTYGHIDVMKRAVTMFDEVIVAVAKLTNKSVLFNLDERVAMIEEATKDIPAIKVVGFDGLVVEFAHENNINVLIRGLRMTSDFDYELQMALTNRRLASDVETVFLMPSEGYSFLSSSLIKQTAQMGADVSTFVPKFIEDQLKARLRK